MKAYRVVAAVALVALLAGSVVASSAFTNATMDRGAAINVASDTNGVVALTPGPNNATGGVVTTSGDTLTIDFAAGTGASGANPDAVFDFGDSTNADHEYAFSVTNADNDVHDITLSYGLAGSDPDAGVNNVEFTVYDADGTNGQTFSEGGSVTLSSVASGGTHKVVLVVDTSGLDSADDLSGTLTVTAN